MRIKLFTAPGMPEAIAAIRAELGPDAVILGSRRVRGGIEVTAARDDPEPQPPPLAPLPPRGDCPLRAHGTPDHLAARLRGGPLPFALSVAFRFRPLDAAALARPIVFLGPPGAGKTLTVARLATRMVLAGGGPRLLTADTSRACAFEQLAAFATLLDLPLAPFSADQVPQGPTLIDTAGLDPFTAADRDEITFIVAASRALPVLVLPGGIDAVEAAELAAAFAACGASRLIATRLDIARRLGGILAAAERLPLAEAGIGASAAEGLVPMTPERLASILQRRQRPRSFA
ncbi:MAG: hypothetical protein NT133_20550 [Alphaproteobacteria bacterium]|nr:hypothetical protein [Alphaproteobacteria bacterium]